MYQQFNISANPVALANAAAFLRKEGLLLRSRNQLVNECIRAVAAMAEQDGVAVATSDGEALDFLFEAGLAGDASKAKSFALGVRKREQFSEASAMAQRAAELSSQNAKLGKKAKLPDYMQPTEANILDLAQRSSAAGETLEEFHEFASAALGVEALQSEALREKVSKLFNKKEN